MNIPRLQLSYKSIAVQLLLGALPCVNGGCGPAGEPRDPLSAKIPWIREAADQLAASEVKPLESNQLGVALGEPDVRASYETFINGLTISPHGKRQTNEHQRAVARRLEEDYQYSNSVLRRAERRMAPLSACELWVYDLRSRSPEISPDGWFAYVFFVDKGAVLGSTYLMLWQER